MRLTWRRSCGERGLALARDAIDAGYAFGFSSLSHFRRIALPPLLLAAAPVSRQPGHPNRQGQCILDRHRVAGVDARGQFNPIEALAYLSRPSSRPCCCTGGCVLPSRPPSLASVGSPRSADKTLGAAANRSEKRPVLTVAAFQRPLVRSTVLDDINLQVQRGETICLLGPSGSGKSTLLRCINWLDEPDSGQIYLNGERVGVTTGRVLMGDASCPASARASAWCFSILRCGQHLTVLQNIMDAPIYVQTGQG